MEPSKLRGISIIAAEAAASEKPRGIPIRAVRAVVADALLLTRSLSGTFSSAGSVPIRASVTSDDSGSVTDEHNSDASKGTDSGADDGFESVSGDADDETELEGLVRDEHRVHGVLGEESVGENGDGSDFSGGSVAGDVEEERSVNYSPLEEESEGEADGVGMKAEVVIPRAILSLDDDGVLGISNGDKEIALLHGDEEAEVQDIMLQFGDMIMVDEPECSDSVLTDVVSTEGEAVEAMKVTYPIEDGLISIEDLSLSGGSNDSPRYQDFIAQRSSRKMHGIVFAENNNMSSLCGSESTCQDWRLKLLILCCLAKNAASLLKPVEKPDAFSSSQLASFTLFCSLWNVLLVDSKASQSLDDLEEKKRCLLDLYPEILHSQESLKQEMMKNQEAEAEDEERRHEEEKRSMSVRTKRRRGRLGFQATKRFGIYLDTCDLHTGFSMGSSASRMVEQEEGKLLVRMRGSLSVLGVVHMLTFVITCVYGGKYN